MKKVLERSRSLEYVKYEGALSRKELVTMINKHKFGIHGRWKEHFGISVAEMVAGNTITFVPEGGGQTEIVDNSQCIYSSIEDAVEKIDSVLCSSELPDPKLSEKKHKFDKESFKQEVIQLVEESTQ
jgi:hypothetical protein